MNIDVIHVNGTMEACFEHKYNAVSILLYFWRSSIIMIECFQNNCTLHAPSLPPGDLQEKYRTVPMYYNSDDGLA